MDKHFTSYNIEDRSFVAFVKREIHASLPPSQFAKNKVAEIDIVVAEITSNLIKHAGKGELLYRINNGQADNPMLEIISIDDGPGMADVHRMMKDGVSTTKTLGQGLGAIQRLSDSFNIFSIPKWGTVSYTRVSARNEPRQAPVDVEIKAISVPKPKEIFCGDGHAVRKTKDEVRIFLGDGLGHGEFAAEAIKAARTVFFTSKESDPVEIIREMHHSVRKTRGLVGTVAVLDLRKKEWRLCGVGNIIARLYGGMIFKHYLSYNGIIGLNIPRSMKCSTFEMERNQQLIMCSDGIRSRWDLTRYPSILKYDPMLLAAALYKDFTRRNDDSSVLVTKVLHVS